MDTLARIKDLAGKEFSLDAQALDPGAPLDKLGIDSLSFIEFMFKVEEEFGVSVSDEDLKGIRIGVPRELNEAVRAVCTDGMRSSRGAVGLMGMVGSTGTERSEVNDWVPIDPASERPKR